jgi:hypothetical protein
MTSKVAKPGKTSNSVKDQKKLTAKTSGSGPKKANPFMPGKASKSHGGEASAEIVALAVALQDH